MPLPINVTTRDINWWAESADGLCTDVDVYLVAVGNTIRLRRADQPPEDGEQTLAVIRRPIEDTLTAPSRVAPRIAFVLEGGTPVVLETSGGEACDAFFTTASAAAKFVYPYYEAQRLLTAAEMAELKKPFGADVVGIAHYPPSRPNEVLSDGTSRPIGHYPLETAFAIFKGSGGSIHSLGLSQYALKLASPS